jgi:hypothetical protein
MSRGTGLGLYDLTDLLVLIASITAFIGCSSFIPPLYQTGTSPSGERENRTGHVGHENVPMYYYYKQSLNQYLIMDL